MALLSPDVFDLLESQELQVAEGIETLIKENLASTKESWLVNSLVDYYYLTQSDSVVGILCKVQDPHDKFLLDKLHDGIKSQEHQLHALQLLLHLVCKQPLWVNKIVSMSVLKVVIKCLKVETNIPVLMTGVTILTILLPSVPSQVGTYLLDIFEVFTRLASFTVKKPPGSTPDIFYLHLQISVYALFHRLYGMFPYNFLAYLRQYCEKKENLPVFEEVIKGMLERVRVHPLLFTAKRDWETSSQRWRTMEAHDIVVECNKMSLDPVEGTWEELHCPVVASRYLKVKTVTGQPLGETRTLYDDRRRQVVQPLSLPTILSACIQPIGQSSQSQEIFWSPSEILSLSTPPLTPVAVTADVAQGNTSTLSVPPSSITLTPMNTPRETPPISEEHDRIQSRTSSRGPPQIRIGDPKRLSAEFSSAQPVPTITPSSHGVSVPPSPLKAEFTNTPPLGVKTLPVVNAARELQFDQDQSEDRILGHVTKINQSRMEFSKQQLLQKVDEQVEERRQSDGQVSQSLQSQTTSIGQSDQRSTEGQNMGQLETPEPKDTPRTASRNSSVHMFEESLKDTLQRNVDADTTSIDGVSIDNISQVIQGFERQSSHEDESDDEVSELTSTSRSHQMTSESVKKFMKSVNRIRFNSLTASEHDEQNLSKFGSKRSRSCPQLPKVEAMAGENENISRSVSVSNQYMSETEVTFDTQMMSSEKVTKDESFSVASTQTSDSLRDLSVVSTNSVTTVNKKNEMRVTFSVSNTSETTMLTCPIDSVAQGEEPTDKAARELVFLLRQLLNVPSTNICAKCQGHIDPQSNGTAGTKPFFSTFSPPELLDMHIKLGRDIHAKELSKLPITSNQDVNWTHFGGVPPADEISILRGQLMLLHNQLMYERHKRDQHAYRNRRLLRKITHTKSLEEQNRAMMEQIRQNEMMIRDLQVSLKLIQEENRKLKKEKESEDSEKFVQLRCCLKENEDLKNAKKEFNMLLVRQREEQDQLNKKLMDRDFKLFHVERELEKIRDEASANAKLKDQMLQLQKELLLMGELQQKCQEKLLNQTGTRVHKLEWEQRMAALSAELKACKEQLSEKTVLLDSCQHQLKEQQDQLSSKELALTDLKSLVEKIKTSHDDELKCIEDKHRAAVRIGQNLESHILQLYMELEEAKAKLHKEGSKLRYATGSSTPSGHQQRPSQEESPELEGFDPDARSRKTLSRTISLPAGDLVGHSTTPPQKSPGACPGSLGAQKSFGAEKHLSPATLLEEYDLIRSHDSGEDSCERQTGSYTSSRETSMMHHNLLNTESDDNQSTYNRSGNTGDSGFN